MTSDEQGLGTAFQRFLGMRWSLAEDNSGSVTVEIDLRDDLRGPSGSLEGGVVSSLADVAGASSIGFSVGMVATQHIALSFLAAGRVGPVAATGVPIRIGRRSGVAEVRIVDKGAADQLMAMALVTVVISKAG